MNNTRSEHEMYVERRTIHKLAIICANRIFDAVFEESFTQNNNVNDSISFPKAHAHVMEQIDHYLDWNLIKQDLNEMINENHFQTLIESAPHCKQFLTFEFVEQALRTNLHFRKEVVGIHFPSLAFSM